MGCTFDRECGVGSERRAISCRGCGWGRAFFKTRLRRCFAGRFGELVYVSVAAAAGLEQPEPPERLFDRGDLFRRTRILGGRGSRRPAAELLFALQNPRALRKKAVLARDPFLETYEPRSTTRRKNPRAVSLVEQFALGSG